MGVEMYFCANKACILHSNTSMLLTTEAVRLLLQNMSSIGGCIVLRRHHFEAIPLTNVSDLTAS